MKIIRYYLLPVLILAISALCMQSCKDKDKKEESSDSLVVNAGQFASTVNNLLTAVGTDDADLYITGSAARVLEQSGFTINDGKIEMPANLKKILSNLDENPARISKDLNSLKGLDYTAAAVVVNSAQQEAIFVANVNYDEFLQSIRAAGQNKVRSGQTNGYQVIVIDNAFTFVSKDGMLFFPISKNIFSAGETNPNAAVQAVEQWKTNAGQKPMASWKKNYLSQYKVVNVLSNPKKTAEVAGLTGFSNRQQQIMEKFRQMIPGEYTEMDINLEGPSMVMNSAAVTKDGTPVNLGIAGNFDTNLMKYSSPNDFLAVSLAINAKTAKNIANTLMEIAEMDDAINLSSSKKAFVKGIIPIIAASWPTRGIYFTLGLDKNFSPLDAMNRSPKELINMVIAAKFDNDLVASGVYTLVQEKLREEHIDLVVKQDGNNVVISNRPVTTYNSHPFDTSLFTGSAIAFQFIINQGNMPQIYKLIKQMDMNITEGFNISGAVRNTGGNAKFTITGTNQNLIPALLNIALRAEI